MYEKVIFVDVLVSVKLLFRVVGVILLKLWRMWDECLRMWKLVLEFC